MANILEKLFGSNRNVLVLTETGSMQGRTYCKQNQVGEYITDMMKLSTDGRIKVVVEPC